MSATPVISPSPVAFEILKALAEYRYLTTNQIIALGIVRDRGYLGKVLASLLSASRREGTPERKPKEIGELDYGVNPKTGRRPRMYYLTKRGAQLLELLDSDQIPARYPSRVVRFAPDYQHRVSCVDFQMAVSHWAREAGQDVIDYRQYFYWSKGTKKINPHPVTRLFLYKKRLDTDALFNLKDPSGVERSFVFEMVNGRETTRVLAKMEHLAIAIHNGSLNSVLSIPANKAVRIIFVFEHQRVAELVAGRAHTFPYLKQYAQHFYLKSIDDISPANLKEGWLTLSPSLKTRSLF